MKRRAWWVAIVGAAVALTLSALHFEGPASEPTVSNEEPLPQLSKSAQESTRVAAQRGQIQRGDKRQAKRVDPEKVRAALARLDALNDSISQRALDGERELMSAKEHEFASVETPEPKQTAISDARGRAWVQLEYPSGEVRYEFPAD